MRIKQLDLLLAVAIALLNIVWALIPGRIPVIGLLIGLPLVFFLPGYTLTAIFFYRRPLDGIHCLILSLGLSIAIDIISGFILNVFPWGLSALTWALCLSTLTGAFSLLAVLHRRNQRAASTGEVWLLRLRFDLPKQAMKHAVPALLLAAALGTASLTVLYSASSAVHQRRPGFTELWMVQADKADKSCAVLIGVDNFEFVTLSYRVVMTINDAQANTWSPITLSPQQSWQASASIHSSNSSSIRVDVKLYRADKPGFVYRDVHRTFYRLQADNKRQERQQCTS